MDKNSIKENLSRRFIEIIANRKGFITTKPDQDYGVDLIVTEVNQIIRDGKRRFLSGRSVELQIKATTRVEYEVDLIKYDLEVKNYNDLIDKKKYLTKQILILFVLPENEEEWLTLTEDQLIIKKCAYWYYPEENERSSNDEKIRIKIPKSNLVKEDFFTNIIEENYYEKN